MPEDAKDAARSLTGRGVYPPKFAWLLTLPLRRLIISPGALADRLALRPADDVLEVGPGPGYFSVEVSRRVPQGSLTLIDLQPEMLERARRRLTAARAANVRFAAADAAAMPFEEASFDAAFLVTVIGEVADRESAARELGRVLRPGGRLSITESAGDPDRMTEADLGALLAPHGFVLMSSAGGRRARTTTWKREGRISV